MLIGTVRTYGTAMPRTLGSSPQKGRVAAAPRVASVSGTAAAPARYVPWSSQ